MSKKKTNSSPQRAESNAGAPKFTPICNEQLEAYKLCSKSTISFLTGPAGSTKTFTAIAAAVDHLMAGRVEKIILTRPAVEACGESIGYLPGSASEKVAGYMLPLFENIQEYTGSLMDSIRPQLQIAPLSFIRGRTFKNCAVVMDEAQNASLKQLKLFITRLGRGSRMILCGDSEQSDIRFSALRATAEEFASVTGCCHYHFSSTASMARHPLMPDIIDTFDRLEAKHGYQTHA